MNQMQHLEQSVSILESKLHYRFRDPSLLILAFVHRSYVNEDKSVTEHNERLEFLGDAILGMLVSDYLYRHLPQNQEGELSYLRSRLVEASSCVCYVQHLALTPYVLLGKGERMNDGRGRESILADLFEAIIGAIYLDGGLEAVTTFFFGHFRTHVEEILKKPLKNWKAQLQDYCQKKYQQTPEYQVLHSFGPDHSKTFEICVNLKGEELGRGCGLSKKEAQQAAAADALLRFGISGDA